jgi:hypothetical protein
VKSPVKTPKIAGISVDLPGFTGIYDFLRWDFCWDFFRASFLIYGCVSNQEKL